MVHRGNKPLYANQAFADIYGYETSADILALESALELFPEEERAYGAKAHADHLLGKAVDEEDFFVGLKKMVTLFGSAVDNFRLIGKVVRLFVPCGLMLRNG